MQVSIDKLKDLASQLNVPNDKKEASQVKALLTLIRKQCSAVNSLLKGEQPMPDNLSSDVVINELKELTSEMSPPESKKEQVFLKNQLSMVRKQCSVLNQLLKEAKQPESDSNPDSNPDDKHDNTDEEDLTPPTLTRQTNEAAKQKQKQKLKVVVDEPVVNEPKPVVKVKKVSKPKKSTQ
jgi:hypothetical protein